MERDMDVLVIGGGVIGACSAYYLARQGLRVSLVEKGEIASGCSGANAGLIVPSHSIPLAAPGVFRQGLKGIIRSESPFYIKPRLDPLLFSWLWKFRKACKQDKMHRGIRVLRDLNSASLKLFGHLIKSESLKCNFRQDGWLLTYKTDKGFQGALEEAQLLQSYDIKLRIMNVGDALEMEPTLHPEIAGCVYFPDDAHLNPMRFVQALTERLKELGVIVHTKTDVFGFETSSDRIIAVRTAQGDFKPDQVVLAAGVWSREIGHILSLGLPVQPAKGYSISFKRPEICPGIPLYFTEAKVAVAPLDDDLRFAGTFELTGMDFNFSNRRVNAIMRAAKDYLRKIETTEVIEIRLGLRPCSPDGLPIIDRVPGYKNLLIATGHGMLGITLAPVTGKLISQLACDQASDIDLKPLQVARFR
ncbi:MAG: FAD-dependent oxidoreductase [Candidatus Aminicenantes bacterium]|nr:FAD-dependent oxidoreductase [Candidatus Aminicenantes bacterium]